jgi:small GTP-binding protein
MQHEHSYPSLPSYDFKICVLGAGRVGKTSLVKAFFGQTFVEKHIPTVDDYFVHAISIDGNYFSTCIIDTAGSHSFPVMQRLAIESSHGLLVLYALDSEKSFIEALRLLDEIFRIKTRLDGSSRRIVVNLVATKLDIDRRTREITQQQATDEMKARPWMIGDYIEISSKAGFRVMLVFHSLVKNIAFEIQMKEKQKGRRRLTRKMRSYKLAGKDKKKKRSFPRTVKRILKCMQDTPTV